MPRQPTTSIYRINRMHLWFLVANLLMLGALIGIIRQDYTREWKDVQRGFFDIERTRAQAELEQELAERDQAGLDRAQADVAAANADLEAQQAAYDEAAAALNELKGQEYLINQTLKFAKAEVAVYKYNYELAMDGHHDHELAPSEQRYTDKAAEIAATTLKLNGLLLDVAPAQAVVDAFTAAREAALTEVDRLTNMEGRIRERLQRLDDSYGPNKVRDAPMIDFLDPRTKIQQILLTDFVDDLNMDTTMKIDRCTTCHLGIEKSTWTGEAKPYGAHPNLDLFMSSKSPHPVESFGCTVCHSGRGRGTTFLRTTHWPNDREQEERWERERHWHEMHHWDFDMLPARFTQASCFQCHKEQTTIAGADKWNTGIRLMELSGCFGCHKVRGFEDVRKAGPPLNGLAAKTTEAWVYNWVRDPKGYRPTTRMPQFFDLSNVSDEHNRALTTVGINAIVAYLWDVSDQTASTAPPVQGDAARGEALLNSVGCMACHQIGAPTIVDRTHPRSRGPNLSNLGSKLNAGWLYGWLKNPHAYFPDTWMPNLRLTDREAADLTTFLLQDRDAEFDSRGRPESPPEAREELMLEFLRRALTDVAAREKLDGMSADEQDRFLGEKLIARNGCFGCHDIRGFEDGQRIGTELTEEGSKGVLKFDFGLLPSHPDGSHSNHKYTMDHEAEPVDPSPEESFYVPRTRHDWLMVKLMHPRIWDRGRVKGYDEYLKMPNFDFSVEEAEAITTAVLSFQRSLVPVKKMYRMTPRRAAIAKGRALVEELNCRACHIIEDKGRAIAETIEDEAFWPPILTGEGEKVQSQWLFQFLIKPTPIRPWLKVRMPTFGLETHESNTLVEYFARLDDAQFPSEYYEAADVGAESLKAGGEMFTMFQCQQCHVLGDVPKDVDARSLAPNLLMARGRLRPTWVPEWILAPDEYQPGTMMPGFFPDGREEESPYEWLDEDAGLQAEALRDHIFVGLHRRGGATGE